MPSGGNLVPIVEFWGHWPGFWPVDFREFQRSDGILACVAITEITVFSAQFFINIVFMN